jgi:hypothetical protein
MRNLSAVVLLALMMFVVVQVSNHVDVLASFESWGCPDFPESQAAAAHELGGSPDYWHQSANKWTYTGSETVRFTVPKGCVLSTNAGTKRAGESTLLNGNALSWPGTK